MQKAFQSPSKSVGLLSKNHPAKVEKGLANIFQALSLYFDSPFSTVQAETIAIEVLNTYEYRQLKFEDIVVVCKQLKEANIYKLTIAKVLQHINKYVKEREAFAISAAQQKSGQYKNKKDLLNTSVEDRLKKHFHLPPSNIR